jgi:hypothetical protein
VLLSSQIAINSQGPNEFGHYDYCWVGGQTRCLEEVEVSGSLDLVEVSGSLDLVEVSGSLGLVSLPMFTQALQSQLHLSATNHLGIAVTTFIVSVVCSDG